MNEKEILDGPVEEVSFTIHFPLSNERPRGIEPGTVPISVEALDDANAPISDILIVKKNKGLEVKQTVQWVDPIRPNGRTWSWVFDTVVYHITEPKPGMKRLNVRDRGLHLGCWILSIREKLRRTIRRCLMQPVSRSSLGVVDSE